MVNEVTDKVFDYIDAMAESLGVASEYVLEVLIKQQYITGAVNVVVSVVLILVITTVITMIYKIYNHGKYNYKPVNEYRVNEIPTNMWAKLRGTTFVSSGGIWGVFTFVMFVTILSLVILLPQGVKLLINPEYYALKEILNVFKSQ